MIYERGKVARLTLNTTDQAGTPANVTGAVVTVTNSAGATTTPAVANPVVGTYTADVPLTLAGEVTWLWADGAGVTLDEGALTVAERYSTPSWAPTLEDVAGHVPSRTIAAGDVTATMLGTFTTLTVPTGRQVENFIADAQSYITGTVGVVKTALNEQAKAVAALRAAAYVEMAMPLDQRDQQRIQELLDQADGALARLKESNQAVDPTDPTSVTNLLPVFQFPDPPAWGDVNL